MTNSDFTCPVPPERENRVVGADPAADFLRKMPTRAHGASIDMMIVPEAANMLPSPWQTESLAPGIWAGAIPRVWFTLSRSAYMLYQMFTRFSESIFMVKAGR